MQALICLRHDFFAVLKGKHYLMRQTDSVKADTVVSEQSFLKLTFSVISKLVIAMESRI